MLPHFQPSKVAGPGGIRIIALMYLNLLVNRFVTSIVKIVEKHQKFLPYQKYHANKIAKKTQQSNLQAHQLFRVSCTFTEIFYSKEDKGKKES